MVFKGVLYHSCPCYVHAHPLSQVWQHSICSQVSRLVGPMEKMSTLEKNSALLRGFFQTPCQKDSINQVSKPSFEQLVQCTRGLNAIEALQREHQSVCSLKLKLNKSSENATEAQL